MTVGELEEFCVAINGNRGSVILIYGDKKKRRTRRKTPCAAAAVKEREGQNRQLNCHLWRRHQPSQECQEQYRGNQKRWVNRRERVTSGTWTPTSPERKNATHRSDCLKTASRPPPVGPSSLRLTAPVELPTPLVYPVEQVALKRKATPPLMP